MKPPRVGSRQPYHQDQPLGFHIDPADLMVTCWIAFDDSTLENGCLRVLPGTHRNGQLSREAIQEYERRALEGGLESETPLVLKAGEASFHHGHSAQRSANTPAIQTTSTIGENMNSPIARAVRVSMLLLCSPELPLTPPPASYELRWPAVPAPGSRRAFARATAARPAW